jgi:hypothetical protein
MAVTLTEFHNSSFPLDGQTVRVQVARLTKAVVLALGNAWQEAASGPDIPVGANRYAKQVEFAEETIPLYLSVPPGELLRHDGSEVRTGAELVDLFGARQDIMIGLASLILMENRLGDAQKKVLRSQLGSALGWPEWITAKPGDSPARTVTAVEPPISASSGAAMASTLTPKDESDGSSGTTDPSPSDPVPSDI